MKRQVGSIFKNVVKVLRTALFLPNSALVENCKLLEICTTHMRLIIANCSGTIEMTLAICYKNNEKQCGE